MDKPVARRRGSGRPGVKVWGAALAAGLLLACSPSAPADGGERQQAATETVDAPPAPGALPPDAPQSEAAPPIDAAPVGAADGPEAPPLEDGVFIYPACEGEGGCPNRYWRTAQPAELRADHSKSAEVTAALTPGEWVEVEGVETRMVPPRGLVRRETPELRVGDVVYRLEYQGEGLTTVWRRGEYLTVEYDDGERIEWTSPEPPPEISDTLGTWVQMKKESGETGWVKLEYGLFECLGQLAGDADCRD